MSEAFSAIMMVGALGIARHQIRHNRGIDHDAAYPKPLADRRTFLIHFFPADSPALPIWDFWQTNSLEDQE